MRDCLGSRGATNLTERLRSRVINDEAAEDELRALINLTLLSIHHDMNESEKWMAAQPGETLSQRNHERIMDARAKALDSTPVY